MRAGFRVAARFLLSAGLSMAAMMRAARTIFSQVLPTFRTLTPSALVFHRYGSMCTCRFLEPRWHWAARSISMSCWVGLKIAGRLEGAILTDWTRGQLLVGVEELCCAVAILNCPRGENRGGGPHGLSECCLVTASVVRPAHEQDTTTSLLLTRLYSHTEKAVQ